MQIPDEIYRELSKKGIEIEEVCKTCLKKTLLAGAEITLKFKEQKKC